MKLVVPIPADYNLLPFIRSNITEFYFGYIPLWWKEKYSLLNSINRRYAPLEQCDSIRVIKKIIKEFKNKNTNFSMAVNAPLYTTKQINKIVNTVEYFYSIGLGAVIVADIGLILAIKKYLPGIKIHISCVAGCFNSYAADFFKQIGADRIILPRSVGISEIASICARNRNIELEAMTTTKDCLNIDGLCTHHHGKDNTISPCYEEYRYLKRARINVPEDDLQRIYQLFKNGITYLKLPRRGETAEEMLRKNRLVISLINRISENSHR
ncbi:MAG: U32 family peptidase [Candidatus Omnitrophota bacterium]